MDPRDQELLDKQVRRLSPPRHDGLLVLAVAAMFFVGMTFGGMLFAHEDKIMQMAWNDVPAMTFLPHGASPTLRR